MAFSRPGKAVRITPHVHVKKCLHIKACGRVCGTCSRVRRHAPVYVSFSRLSVPSNGRTYKRLRSCWDDQRSHYVTFVSPTLRYAYTSSKWRQRHDRRTQAHRNQDRDLPPCDVSLNILCGRVVGWRLGYNKINHIISYELYHIHTCCQCRENLTKLIFCIYRNLQPCSTHRHRAGVLK